MIQNDYELENFKIHLNTILKKDLFRTREKVMKSCPKCGCTKYMKYGFYNGIQRYKCKNEICGKTFSLGTNSIWSYSKKCADKWIEFIELMLERRTLKYCAEKLNININTAFFWRHKVLHALTFNSIPNSLFGDVHITKSGVKENFKGARNITRTQREDIIIVSAKGEKDSLLSLPVSKKIWNEKDFNEKIYSRIKKDSYIIPYADRYIFAIAKRHNNDSRKLIKNEVEIIKNYRLISKAWFRCFRGIATKYLIEYLCWFIIEHREKTFNSLECLYDFMNECNFIKISKIREV
ncbi:IS1 family transposase [Clostridium cibarium]|uniref:IS1 family transposase n=1 Tax=Clostridium cibarium TaxID=2762247 RepID=A0ABR8PUH6_9CLOT|nr:IS1 family transposase [Clostridium cibarium]MBD7911807.1 IS1 family transposase [Clostridium cibarium]